MPSNPDSCVNKLHFLKQLDRIRILCQITLDCNLMMFSVPFLSLLLFIQWPRARIFKQLLVVGWSSHPYDLLFALYNYACLLRQQFPFPPACTNLCKCTKTLQTTIFAIHFVKSKLWFHSWSKLLYKELLVLMWFCHRCSNFHELKCQSMLLHQLMSNNQF